MSKLTALIEAAKADCIAREGNYGELCGYGDDILELCALLEKAEEALDKYRGQVDRFGEHTSVEALAAIKQWKEKADAIRGLA